MPYSATALAQTGNALSLEMKGLLDAALTAHPRWSKVTNAYVSSTKTFDVWRADPATDGYEWFLMVMTDTTQTGRLYLGGALEYSDATKIAKKAIRGGSTVGYVDAAGYPLVSAGGAEMTFALSAFAATNTNTVGNMSPSSTTHPTAAVTGNTFRCLVTGSVAWVWWGTASAASWCVGVGTYTPIHGQNWDLKPLGFIAHNSTTAPAGGTVWQHPNTTYIYARPTASSSGSGTSLSGETWTAPVGKLGATGQDPNYATNYVGSRMHVVRDNQAPAGAGGSANWNTQSWSLGLAPADFLIFGRQSSVAIGDTVTVDGKAYVSVTTPAAGAGLFVNTQPAV